MNKKINIECLRILCMLMILLAHFSAHSDIHYDNFSFNMIWLYAINYGRIADVVFILITGYFLGGGKEKEEYQYQESYQYSDDKFILFNLL